MENPAAERKKQGGEGVIRSQVKPETGCSEIGVRTRAWPRERMSH
jgi:hypothetical protein